MVWCSWPPLLFYESSFLALQKCCVLCSHLENVSLLPFDSHIPQHVSQSSSQIHLLHDTIQDEFELNQQEACLLLFPLRLT